MSRNTSFALLIAVVSCRAQAFLAGWQRPFRPGPTPFVDLDLPGGPDRRALSTAFPQKAQMIVQRTRPPSA
jgi:hypothetical protein